MNFIEKLITAFKTHDQNDLDYFLLDFVYMIIKSKIFII